MADKSDTTASIMTAVFLGAALATQPHAFSTIFGDAIIFVLASAVFLITKSALRWIGQSMLEMARNLGEVMLFALVLAGYLGVLLAPWWGPDVWSKLK
jgi:hypothetical protein